MQRLYAIVENHAHRAYDSRTCLIFKKLRVCVTGIRAPDSPSPYARSGSSPLTMPPCTAMNSSTQSYGM